MTDKQHDPSKVPAEPGVPPSRRPYEAPQLVKYGDIATLTQTGGLTKKDTGTKKQRIG